METEKQKCQVIMRPTEKASRLFIIDNKLFYYHKPQIGGKVGDSVNDPICQHLYILSDEEIKEGDWFIYNKALGQSRGCVMDGSKKIIATTDPDLEIKNNFFSAYEGKYVADKLPAPSDDFIKDYFLYYNKGNKVTNVYVEFDVKFDPVEKHKLVDGVTKVYWRYPFRDSTPYTYWEKGEIGLMINNGRINEIWFKTLSLKIEPDNTIVISPLENRWDDIFNDFENEKRYNHYAYGFQTYCKEKFYPPIEIS